MEKYKPIRQIGKGSFGSALLVQPINEPSKYLVIKIIDVSKLGRKQKEEALNEVHVLKALRHPFIVAYRESFVERQCLCIVMDYADGGDLQSKIKVQRQKEKLFTEDEILDWFVQICLALKHIHDRQILHRDIKAQNIFLTSKNEIKLGDFGIARILCDEKDYAKTAIGTPYYLSPEICEEKPYNQKSDIWSLGCILYEMVTLKHAFNGTTLKELMKQITKGIYNPIPKDYSDDLRQLITELLTKNPEVRPSVREILQKEFLNKRIARILKGAISKSSLTNLRTTHDPKLELFKIQSQRNLKSKQNESPSLQRAGTSAPRTIGINASRTTAKTQPTQSQESFDLPNHSQYGFENQFYLTPRPENITPLKPIQEHYRFSNPSQLPINDQFIPTTERILTIGQKERMTPKASLKERPKSQEKFSIRNSRTSQKNSESMQYSTISEINNIIAENLSFVNNIRATTQSTSAFSATFSKKVASPCKIQDPQKIILTNLLNPKEDNQTPEGDMLGLMHLISESDIKKELGNSENINKQENNTKTFILHVPAKSVSEGQPKKISEWRDKNISEAESLWMFLEERLGKEKLQKAYSYLKTNRFTGLDIKLLMRIIGEMNYKYVKDLERLAQIK